MPTYVLIHGAASDAWSWHLVAPLLVERGHDVIAPDLPVTDDAAGFEEYADVVVRAAREATDVVVVAHSLGSFTGVLACERLPAARLLVLLAGMVPARGETAGAWWAATGSDVERAAVARAAGIDADEAGSDAWLYENGVPAALVTDMHAHTLGQSAAPMERPWPHDVPAVPTRVVAPADDHLFPPAFQQRIARERLGIDADATWGGHMAMLSQPAAVVETLERIRIETLGARAHELHGVRLEAAPEQVEPGFLSAADCSCGWTSLWPAATHAEAVADWHAHVRATAD